MSGADGDLLIHRHLEGRLTEDEARAFGDRLRADPNLRRRLAEMAFDQAQLRDLLATVEADEALVGSAEKRVVPGSRAFLATAAALLLAVGTALVIHFMRSEPSSPVAPARTPAEPEEESPEESPSVALDADVMDADDDGRVTRSEWAAAFKRLDADGDGHVTARELEAAGRPKLRDPRK